MIERYCMVCEEEMAGARTNSIGGTECSTVTSEPLSVWKSERPRARPMASGGTKLGDTSDHCTERACSAGGTADGT